MTHLYHFSIPADHPVLAGHFPGNPIVPASMILEQVIAACGALCRGLSSAKFLRPLRGGHSVQIELVVESDGSDGSRVRFSCHCAKELICTGTLTTGQIQ